ncbi:MAG: hypothetical protein WAT92_19825 [Saprospiraceae bacterium]|nr:hypothetical protein [Saprospiraceae bacterium]
MQKLYLFNFRLVFSIGFLLCHIFVEAQTSEIYNDKTLTAFTNVFFEAKNQKPDWNKIGEEILDSLGMTSEQYAAFINSRYDTAQRSSELQIITNYIQQVEANQNLIQKERLLLLCQKSDLPFQKYEELLRLYRTDITFQQTLKPYFSTYLTKLERR